MYLSNPLDDLSIAAQVNLISILAKYENKTVDFLKIIKILNEEVFKIKSIKIKSILHLTQNDMDKLSKSYLFNCAYRHNAVLSMNSIFKKYYTIYPNDDFFLSSKSILNLDIKEELLTYYQQAIMLKDPFESFLSFYHIFEYFFKIIEKEFKESIILKTVKFSGSEEEFKKIIWNGRLKEEKMLQLVFRRFLEEILLKDELFFMKEDYYSYLENNNVKFADANKIDDNKFYESLAGRIYKTRNALVHRKESTKAKYLPFKKEHKEELRKELLLMKVIANQIIIKYSNQLKSNKWMMRT